MLSSFHGSPLNGFVGSVLFARGLISGSDCIVVERAFPVSLLFFSGQFTDTIKTSLIVSSINADMSGISWDGNDTMCCGFDGASGDNNQLYQLSGRFTSTVKTSLGVDFLSSSSVQDISWDNIDTFVVDDEDFGFLTRLSGRFTSTIKTSYSLSGTGKDAPWGIAWDGANTSWCTNTGELVLTSGRFSTTIKDSEDVTRTSTGVSWDGINTPWCDEDNVLVLQSGQYTSTIKDSLAISGFSQFEAIDDVTRTDLL